MTKKLSLECALREINNNEGSLIIGLRIEVIIFPILNNNLIKELSRKQNMLSIECTYLLRKINFGVNVYKTNIFIII